MECRPSIWSPRMVEDKARRVCLSRTQLSPNRESELIYFESNRDDHGQWDRKKARRAGCLESWGRCTQPWKEGEIMRSEMRREDGWLDCQGRGHRDISDTEGAHLD